MVIGIYALRCQGQGQYHLGVFWGTLPVDRIGLPTTVLSLRTPLLNERPVECCLEPHVPPPRVAV
ncbi:MAG: hypothetical protein KDA75_07315 [Planctomycetaceae bacterium]|nr:hypothetical protein [Planctomycetaceae bacterium]